MCLKCSRFIQIVLRCDREDSSKIIKQTSHQNAGGLSSKLVGSGRESAPFLHGQKDADEHDDENGDDGVIQPAAKREHRLNICEKCGEHHDEEISCLESMPITRAGRESQHNFSRLDG